MARATGSRRDVDDVGDDVEPGRPVLAFAREARPGQIITRHFHRRAQLLFALRGVMEVITDNGTWIVPPRQAVWIPPALPHEVRFKTEVSLRSAYVHASLAHEIDADCQVVSVPDLLAQLVLKVHAMAPSGARYLRLCEVLVDELGDLDPEPLHLPLPRDARLTPIVHALRENPGDTRSLDEWANLVGASNRTVARAFVAGTGMSFTEWRTQLRLHAAVTRLAAGDPITAVALDLGYASPSAFIAMFRRALGSPPARYFRESRAAPGVDGADADLRG